MKTLKLPHELEEFREAIEKSKTDFIKVYAKEKSSLSLKQSKFGGHPFLPVGMEYPKALVGYADKAYKPMILLAQINFKELPENNIFPKNGILQIYIADDDCYGCGKYNSSDMCKGLVEQEGFKIVYHEDDTLDHQQNFDFSDDFVPEYSPLGFENVQYELTFEGKEEYVPTSEDARFKDFLGEDPFDFFEQFGRKSQKLVKAYSETISSLGHKMGGYAFTLQEDPRESCEEYKDYMLLLQIDTDDKIGWGDCGSAQFFIAKEALKNLDFSKVVYYWASF